MILMVRIAVVWCGDLNKVDGNMKLPGPSRSPAGEGLELQTISQSRRGPLNRAFSWLKAPTSAFTFKTLLRHYAKQALTQGK